jgi:putative transposase
MSRSREERVALIERDNAEMPVTRQADLLTISRSSLYYHSMGPSPAEVALRHRIDEIYTRSPFYGSRRIAAQLDREGVVVNRKAVQRHMQEMGLAGVAPGPHLSTRAPQHPVYPYLLRTVTSAWPNHVWGIDITYIRLQAGWMYLVAILDWYSRYVVSWALDLTLELPFVLEAAQRALVQATPQIWNSDQGSHFTSPQYLALLQAAAVQISMDGKGRALDNIFTERLWRTIKYEEVYLHSYSDPKEARQGLSRYLDFYNHRRPHQALGYRTPAEVYFGPAAPQAPRPAGAPAAAIRTSRKGENPTLQTPFLLS